jgi:hypothetical protein
MRCGVLACQVRGHSPSCSQRHMQVVVEMVTNKLAEDEVRRNGWLLDGYPRRCFLVPRLAIPGWHQFQPLLDLASQS